MATKMKINFSHPDFEGIAKRRLNKIHKVAATDAMGWFMENQIKRRFDGSMDRKLYRSFRDPWYENLKSRWGSSRKDHRKTGKSARMAESSKRLNITPKKMAVVISLGPQYGRMRPKAPSGYTFHARRRAYIGVTTPNLREEMQNVFAGEEIGVIFSKYSEKYTEEMGVELSTQAKRKQIT
jgi:hypothetical protein